LNHKEGLLRIHVEAMVPLRVAELSRLSFGEIQTLAVESVDVVAEKGDVILYRGKKKGETSKAVCSLVTGLACLSFSPGGVSFLGLRFETALGKCQVTQRPETFEMSLPFEP